jgi:hypothetical protein
MEEDKPKPKFEAALQQNMLIKEKWKIEKLIGIPFLFLKKKEKEHLEKSIPHWIFILEKKLQLK